MAIARAIVSDPPILLCDEPTGDLDRSTADEIMSLLQQLNRDYGKTIVMVTHDPRAASFAHRVLHLGQGRTGRRAGGNPLVPATMKNASPGNEGILPSPKAGSLRSREDCTNEPLHTHLAQPVAQAHPHRLHHACGAGRVLPVYRP